MKLLSTISKKNKAEIKKKRRKKENAKNNPGKVK